MEVESSLGRPRRIVSFESRLAEATRQLLERQGWEAILAPSRQEVPLERNDQVFEFARRLFQGEFQILLCLTGVGSRMLLQALETRYERRENVQALSSLLVVARGPKPAAVLREYRIPIGIAVPEPNTWRDLLQALDSSAAASPLAGKGVAVQEYGESNRELLQALESRQARVFPIPVYRWQLPDDLEPLKQGIRTLIQDQAQGVLFTSQRQVDHVFEVARLQGWEKELRRALQRVAVGSIGPICSERLRACGVPVDFEPPRPKLALLIQQASERIPQILHSKEARSEPATGPSSEDP